MIQVRPSTERGRMRLDWLDSFHTFSFGHYHDPDHMGVGALRVLNDDTVAAGAGFAPHSHRDMEIVSLVLQGALSHRDSEGHGSTLRAGDVQRMSAGSGITHSEMNESPSEATHFLQIWIEPNERGTPPSYEEASFPPAQTGPARLRTLVSPDGRDGSLRIDAQAVFRRAELPGGGALRLECAGRAGWLQVVTGTVAANGIELSAGDGARIEDEAAIALESEGPAEVLWIELDAPADADRRE